MQRRKTAGGHRPDGHPERNTVDLKDLLLLEPAGSYDPSVGTAKT